MVDAIVDAMVDAMAEESVRNSLAKKCCWTVPLYIAKRVDTIMHLR